MSKGFLWDAQPATAHSQADIGEHFRVVRGEIVATNADRVFRVLTPRFGETIVLHVQAMTSPRALDRVKKAFRVGQWPLSVTLEPPPSNRALPVPKIEVGIPLPGTGIAVQRVSNAKGRAEITSFPNDLIALECVAVSELKYGYGQATLVHSGQGRWDVRARSAGDARDG